MTMLRIQQTVTFAAWLDGLRDTRAQAKIAQRIVRMQGGLMGDWKSLGDGVSEIRIDYGPGYRLYFALRGGDLVILLCGGDKGDQRRAIATAKQLAAEL